MKKASNSASVIQQENPRQQASGNGPRGPWQRIASAATHIVVVIVLLFLIAAARLIIAPVSLEFLHETANQRLSTVFPNWTLKFDKILLAWDWHRIGPMIELQNLAGQNIKDGIAGKVKRVDLRVPLRVFEGAVDLRTLSLEGVSLYLTDSTMLTGDDDKPKRPEDLLDVSDKAEPSNSTQEQIISGEALRPIIGAILDQGDRLDALFPSLRSITVQDARIEATNHDSARSFRIFLQRMALDRQADGFGLLGKADLYVANRRSGVEINISLNLADRTSVAQIGVSNIVPPNLVEPYNLPAALEMVQVPIDINVGLQLSADKGLEFANYRLDLGSGVLSDKNKYPTPAPITNATFQGNYDASARLLHVTEGQIKLDTINIGLSGDVDWVAGEAMPAGKFKATLDKVRIKDILTYWPTARRDDGSEKGGRAWIARNMIGGYAGNANFSIEWDHQGKGPFKEGSLFELFFEYWDLDSYVAPTMPPLLGASGRGHLTNTILDIEIDKADLLDVEISDSRAMLDNIHRKVENTGYFHIHLTGKTRDVLEVADYRPVRVSERIKVDLDRFSGDADLYLDLSIPLIDRPPASQTHYLIEGTLKNTGFNDLFAGEGLREGDLALTLNKEHLVLTGNAKLNGMPLALQYTEALSLAAKDKKADTSFIRARFEGDVDDLQSVNVDLDKWGEGSFTADAIVTGRGLAMNRVEVSADISNILLKIDEIGWREDVSAGRTLNGDLGFSDGKTVINSLSVRGENIDASLEGTIGTKDDPAMKLNVIARKIGQNSFRAVIERTADQKTTIQAEASTLDLRTFIRPDAKAKEEEESADADDLELSVNARRALLLNGEALRNAKLNTNFANGGIENGGLSAFIEADNSPVVLEIKPLGVMTFEEATPNMSVYAENAGRVLRGLGFFSHLEGGILNFSATSRGWGSSYQIRGDSRIEGGLIVPATALGKEVTIGLIEGMNDYVDSEGIELEKAVAPISYDKGLVDFDGLRANGSSIGITLEGQIQPNRDKINVNGVVVPAYTVNAFLGKIPILGGLFTGGEGKGMFAVPYRVKGKLSSPEVSVSAASSVVPGFLRLLFEGEKGTIEDIEPEGTGDAPVEETAKSVPEAVTPSQESEAARHSEGSEEDPPE